jgi:RNA-directed DNA polymerase
MKNYSNKYILDSLNLPIFEDFYNLAQQIRISQKLLYVLTNANNLEKYHTFLIPKKSGSEREISAPVYSLKIVQRWILENILYKMKISSNCYGFIKSVDGPPILKNAGKHVHSIFILKMDLKDFFPSISKVKVFNLFKSVGYNNYMANALANLCTYNGKLPQGAVTSPYLSNLICYKLDYRIEKYCTKREIIYTRYADDLTFSNDNRDLLHKIFGMIQKIVEDEGFKVNKDKTVFMTPKMRKSITGITINEGFIKAPIEFKRNVRAMLHKAIVTGDYSNLNKIQGYISYINSIEKDYRDNIFNYIVKLENSTLSIHPKVVSEFNKHKIFKELPDMKVKDVSEFAKIEDVDEIASFEYGERQSFLENHGYKVDNDV